MNVIKPLSQYMPKGATGSSASKGGYTRVNTANGPARIRGETEPKPRIQGNREFKSKHIPVANPGFFCQNFRGFV